MAADPLRCPSWELQMALIDATHRARMREIERCARQFLGYHDDLGAIAFRAVMA